MESNLLSMAQTVALQFARALAQHSYQAAYALTTPTYQSDTSLAIMQAYYERIIPDDWGPVETVALDDVLEDWPGKQPGDLGWIYISLEGQHYPYSEGLHVCVTNQAGTLLVRDVTFGR